MAMELQKDQDFFLPKTNRIYNSHHKNRNIQSYRGANPLKNPRASLNNLRKEEPDDFDDKFQERPQSTQAIKNKKNSEIFKSNNDVLNYEKRPGSSKSSRLFKRKGPFNDTINSENEEGEPLIRMTSIGASRAEASHLKGKETTPANRRNRVGTSLPQGQRGV